MRKWADIPMNQFDHLKNGTLRCRICGAKIDNIPFWQGKHENFHNRIDQLEARIKNLEYRL